jgi:hypothetical protein
MPPEWMWALDEELADWFEDVTAARKERYGGGDSSEDEAPMMRNQMTRGMKR